MPISRVMIHENRVLEGYSPTMGYRARLWRSPVLPKSLKDLRLRQSLRINRKCLAECTHLVGNRAESVFIARVS